jgi:glycosyltransferase involved in cell wall biosynthesis
VNACDPRTLLALRRYDVVVVKDELSLALSLACRAAGTPVVYLDAMFGVPGRRWRAALVRQSLTLADSAVAYSRSQIELWAAACNMSVERFKFLPYTIDVSFYRERTARATSRPYVLAVGRDPGRDFGLLVEAMDGLGIDLKLVTLPYLVNGVGTARSWIEVLRDLSYDQLFQLYADALLVAVPLKRDVTHPSGIRGMLEAMVLGKAVVATRSPVLLEYAAPEAGVVYAEPDNPASLRQAIAELHANSDRRQQIAARGRELATTCYGMDRFAREFEQHLERVLGGAVVRRAS